MLKSKYVKANVCNHAWISINECSWMSFKGAAHKHNRKNTHNRWAKWWYIVLQLRAQGRQFYIYWNGNPLSDWLPWQSQLCNELVRAQLCLHAFDEHCFYKSWKLVIAYSCENSKQIVYVDLMAPIHPMSCYSTCWQFIHILFNL